MPNTIRRKLATGNKYQTRIVLISFFPALLLCLYMALLILLMQSENWQFVIDWAWLAVIVFSLLFVLAGITVFVIANHLIGPFERIIRELDAVIEGKSHNLISARPGDDLANELLKRINSLIQKR